MQNDIRLQYEEAINSSHHGQPTVVTTVNSGGPGRPRVHIDPQFLEWAYAHRSTSGIARFLGVSRTVVRNALLEHGIAQSQQNPFTQTPAPSLNTTNSDNLFEDADDLLNPDLPIPTHLQDVPRVTSFTGPLSTMTDDELDDTLMRLRTHYRRAGITMLDGMLRRLGHPVPRERIRESLVRIDPVQRVFQRIRIRRRVYQVAGPNALWHHDGQHGK
jgi:hypothetical protein